MDQLIVKLHAIGAIKFGSFEIQKDFFSPFQVDLKGVISHPDVAKELCTALWTKAMHLSFELLCGVPFVASCLATYTAWQQDLPLVCLHEKHVEGTYKTGQNCLVLQDVLLSGSDVLDSIDILEEEGLQVRDVLSLLDLGLGGKKKIKGRGFVAHHVFGMEEILQTLFDAKKLGGDQFKLASDFLENG